MRQPACFPAEPETLLAFWLQAQFSAVMLPRRIAYTPRCASRREIAPGIQTHNTCILSCYDILANFLIAGRIWLSK
jgi:hypothetical protein